MAHGDNNFTRFKSLINNPKEGSKKIIPFIKSKFMPYCRRFFELLGIYRLSTPFSGHEAFLPHVNFKNGFFVQCGGMDGFGNDPTYYLERAMGWKGIIIEPLPVHALCRQNRPASTVYNFAVGSFENRDTIVPFIDCYGMSFVKGSIDNEKEWIEMGEKTQRISSKIIQVPMKPVQDLIDEYFINNKKRGVDLLVIDTEGYELNVLRGVDFDKNKPKQILVEISRKRFETIQSFLELHDYSLIDKFDNDYLFKLNDI